MADSGPHHVGGQSLVQVSVKMPVVNANSLEPGEDQPAHHSEPLTGIKTLEVYRQATDMGAVLHASSGSILRFRSESAGDHKWNAGNLTGSVKERYEPRLQAHDLLR